MTVAERETRGGPTEEGGSSFAPELERILRSAASGRVPPVLRDPGQPWLYVEPDSRSLPRCGWKLHVSAINPSALEVLERAVPVLLDEAASFKIAASYEALLHLNHGLGGGSQVGKFVTVYPADATAAVRLASKLDHATRGLRGPRIRGDRPLSPTSLVHYRWGDFAPPAVDATTEPAPHDDPFVEAGVAQAPGAALVAGRYLVTSTLHRSIRGAVHLAVDLERQTTVILKRAGRDAWAMPDGTDARDRLRCEARLFELLRGAPGFPRTGGVFEYEQDAFLPMEYVQGVTLAERLRDLLERGEVMPPAEILAVAAQVATALEEIHAVGYVHRDVTPGNVMIRADGSVRLVDLELALPRGESYGAYIAGTREFMSPGQRSGAPADPHDDVYALAAVIFIASTGMEPPAGARAEDLEDALTAKNPSLARPVLDAVARCLLPNGHQEPSMAGLRALLLRDQRDSRG